MTKSLLQVKKDLKAFAKRCKDFKYTDSALFTFLLCGMLLSVNLFSAATTDSSIQNQVHQINTSISQIRTDFKRAKIENNKLIKGTNLELIQLMEQGDQVVKSPFSSWQFGINYFYDDWKGTYKGRGDKTKNIIYQRDPNSKFGTYTGGKYGTTALNKKVIEPISAVPVDAAVKPKDIQKTALNIQLPEIGAPSTPNLNISVKDPAEIAEIKVNPPKISVVPPVVNTDVFTDYAFSSDATKRPISIKDTTVDGTGKAYYGGYTPNYSGGEFLGSGEYLNKVGTVDKNTGSKTVSSEDNRAQNIIYANGQGGGFTLKNFDIHAAGNNGNNGKTLAGTDGQIAIHTVSNGKLENINGYLYGQAVFASLETWWAGKMGLTGIKLKVQGDKNTVFYIFPGTYKVITSGHGAHLQRGGFDGHLDADISSNNNIIYSILGASGSFGIDSRGTYKLEGSGNLVYAGLGYSADFSKLVGTGTIPSGGTVANWKPFIKLTTPVESYGDNNIILFFNNKLKSPKAQAVYGGNRDTWNSSTVGIYQGEIDAKAKIGFQAQLDGTKNYQTTDGNKLITITGATVPGDINYVEKNVGIYSRSGQREEITPSKDLGAEKTPGNTSNVDFDKDKVHSLQINNAEITFGKYSKDGIMLASENGTVMDVLMPTNAKDVTTMGSSIKDYDGTAPTSSYDDNSNSAATGTIIAYSKGEWDKNNYYIDNGNNQMQSATALALQGKGSEINIGKDVELSARYKEFGSVTNITKSYPIAYVAMDKGIVNAYGNTTAHGYGSIVGYASGAGQVMNYGAVNATDDKAASDADTKKYLYTNIGGYATGTGSKVTLGSNSSTSIAVTTKNGTATVSKTITTSPTISTIHGIGALADQGGEVILRGTTNINTGTSGGLIALNGGKVEYEGGTITHKNNSTLGSAVNDHDNTTPFYAKGDTSDGTIVFKGATTLDMYDGVLITGTASDYNTTTGTEIYQGMGNVTVNLKSDNVTIGAFSGLNQTWDDQTDASHTYINGLSGINTFNGGTVNTNNHSYKSILTSGKLDVTASKVELDNKFDQYNNIQMANEVVTIGNTTNVTGDVSSASIKGQGLSMGSLKIATSNATTGFNNEGIINVRGGTAAAGIAGMNVSFGTINNGKAAGSSASVTIDNGAGLYGTNGSKLVNNGTITVSKSGAGIAGIGTGRTKQNYGTDVQTSLTTKTVDIENHGTISVAGDKAVAIYAENNTNAPKANVTVVNDKQLTVGTDGVGIAVISTTPAGATSVNHGTANQGGIITTTATGTGSDIVTGVNGKGIYAKNSDINLRGGDYVVETKEGGIGIFASGNTNVTGTLEYKYNGSTTGTGMGIVYDQIGAATHTNNANVKLTNATNTTGGMVGVYTTAGAGNTLTNNGDITGSSTALEFGIVSDGADIVNNKTITLGNAASQTDANVGIYSKAKNTITNNDKVTVGDNAIGIYGYNVNNNKDIKAGDNGVAIYTQGNGTTVNLNSGSTITVGKNQAVGVYAVGSGQHINADTGSSMTIGNNSFGIVNVGSGNTVTSQTTNTVTLGTDAVYIYQNDSTGHVFNYTPLTSTGDRNYGLYGNGTINNNAVINFTTGNGNVGMYATTGGIATNNTGGVIKVGASNTAAKEFGVGMATGYYDDDTSSTTYGQTFNQGTVINRGTIEVRNPNTMGMYAVGAGSKAVNYGHINLLGSETVGMYIDRGAVGENWGTIQTAASGLTKVKGVYVANGGYIKNYGTINIAASDPKSAGIWTDKAENVEENANGVNPVTGANQTGTSTPAMKVATADDMKDMGGRTIKVPPRATSPTVTDVDGSIIPIYKVDTNDPAPAPTIAIVTSPSGITSINLATSNFLNFPSASEASSLGMYVDTSGVNYTNPIQGINNLTGLTDINLFFGTEASRYTTARAIEVGDNILKPYNDALSGVVTAGTTLNVTSASLTWMAQPTKNAATGLLDKVYLVKIPYTMFANKDDKQTYNFLTGLEQKYGQEGLGTREKAAFDKISNLSGGEGHILAQAIDEMKGHQYSNIQQRMFETGSVLSKEFDYLQDEWRNPSKNSNKIKVFGQKGEFKTDTAGVVDYTNNAYGVAYVHENEKIKLGNKSGWYAGSVYNKFKFKDIGKSQEEQTMIKAGVFKTMSPKKDYNGSLTWKIAGEAFAGRGDMKRRYWIVDEVFEAKGKYTTYGIALKNEIGKEFRTSENTSIRPYGALNLEYGKYSDFRETGPMALKVKGNDYFSAKPEAGISFNYKQDLGVRSKLTASLTAAYENELGELYDVQNKAKLKGTKAPYYKLRGDKENHRGNGKFDLNFGWDNTRFGVTVNAGYDTTGENFRGGIGFRAIY